MTNRVRFWVPALGAALVVVLLAGAEFVLWASGYQPRFFYAANSLAGWGLNPNYAGPGPSLYKIREGVPVSVNSFGFRGSAISLEKEEGVLRIITMGDSCTFGLGQTDTETWPFFLDQLLNSGAGGAGRFEVINAGVPGHSSFQGKLLLESYIREFKPDFITFYYGWNDHHFASDAGIEDRLNLPLKRNYIEARIRMAQKNPFRRLRIYAFFSDGVLRMRHLAATTWSTTPKSGTPLRVSLTDYRENLGEMVQFCLKHEIKPILLTAPHSFERGKMPAEFLMERYMRTDDSLLDLHETYLSMTREVSRSENVRLVDLDRVFEQRGRRQLMEKDGIHPNAEGNLRIAREVARAISQMSIKN